MFNKTKVIIDTLHILKKISLPAAIIEIVIHSNKINNSALYVFLLLLLLLIDYLRDIFGSKIIKIITMLTCIIMSITINAASGDISVFLIVYIFLLISKTLNEFDSTECKLILGTHFITFSISKLIKYLSPNSHYSIANLCYFFINYFLLFVLLYLFMALYNQTNELSKKNKNLLESSLKEKEYSLAVERNRISQDLHDSIGHNLSCLSLYTNYLEEIIKNNDQEEKEVVNKLQALIRESMSDLRLTINKLKTYDEIPHLKDSLTELLNKFDSFNIIKINLFTEGDIDDMPLKYKNLIYYSIKEGIVNSLKHSNSKAVTVKVQNFEHYINLSISDNGVGCKKLVHSNGLKKISDMVENLEGQIKFYTNVGRGFKIDIHLTKEAFYD